MKLILTPQERPREILSTLGPYVSALSEAAKKGFDYVLEKEAIKNIHWIVASFFVDIIIVPINPALPVEAKKQLLDQLPENKFISSDRLILSHETAPGEMKELEKPWVTIFSSGTTGFPKGVVLTGSALKASAEAHAIHNGKLSWLLNIPLFHIGGFSIISRALFNESLVAVSGEKFDLEELSDWLGSGTVEGVSIVPTILKRLCDLDDPLIRVKKILVGGSALDPHLKQKALSKGFPILETYGMTETCAQFATEVSLNGGMKLLPGNQVLFDGQDIILVKGPSLATGYLERGQFQPLSLQDGYFQTGDKGVMEEECLLVKGRASDLLISGGVNIYPQELEPIIQGFPGIADIGITSIADAEWGEAICAVMEIQPNETFFPEECKKFLLDKIDPKKVPKHWLFAEKIPRNTSGKLLRKELKVLAEKKFLENR